MRILWLPLAGFRGTLDASSRCGNHWPNLGYLKRSCPIESNESENPISDKTEMM